MTFNTIQWLPQHLAEMTEWQEICKAYDYLLDKAFKELDEIYANQFMDSLTDIGCLIWERLLGIATEEGESIEERRQAIKSYFTGDLPYTENKIREVLGKLAGPEAVMLKVTQSIYEIKIDLTVNAPSTVANVQDIVYKMRPSNMVVRICIHYKQTDDIYVGHAIKQIKTLTPDTMTGGNPSESWSWYTDGGDLLVDENGSVLAEKEGE
nr:MAG TPA: tail protein [Caudoviricetes sp.]